MDLQHYCIRSFFGGNFDAPIEEELQQGITVLDSGSGKKKKQKSKLIATGVGARSGGGELKKNRYTIELKISKLTSYNRAWCMDS